jgi:hypothetical protein
VDTPRPSLFRRIPHAHARELDVDSGQLSVAIMPRASLTDASHIDSCCVFPVYPGESVGVEYDDGTPAGISVSHGSDLCVPDDAQGEWVMVLGDPCYYLDGEYGTDEDYGRACAASSGEDRCGFIDLNGGGRAFVSGTVYGDGSYPVRIENWSLTLLLEHDPEGEDDVWDDEAEDDLFSDDEEDDDEDADEYDSDFSDDGEDE